MSQLKKITFSIFFSFLIIIQTSFSSTAPVYASNLFSFVILSRYEARINIGDQIHLFAFTSNGKKATWKSSNSSIASVNTYGLVTGKKAGTALITAKTKDAEASCLITVNKTIVKLNKDQLSLEADESYRLIATTSNQSAVKFKSSRRSIATIDEYGVITCHKPGKTTITATADGTSATCILTVKSPTLRLNTTSIQLYRGQSAKLSAYVSSKRTPTWKTNKKSVAIVNSSGTITAMKNGRAKITATVDGVSTYCEVVVVKPKITLSATEITIKKGQRATLTAKVSSANPVSWSVSNPNVISVSSRGLIKALKKGKAYVYASEDGTKVRCTVNVTE